MGDEKQDASEPTSKEIEPTPDATAAVEVDETPGTLEIDETSITAVEQEEQTLRERIDELTEEQGREAEEFAAEFLLKVLRLRGVRIDRVKFLTSELHKRGIDRATIKRAIEENPAGAGIAPSMLDDIARSSIEFETRKSSALSFAAGLPGGFAMFATIPGDITQFYIHAFRVMQKTAYVYGWQAFLDDIDDIDDETLGKLTAFLGVMMGVGGAQAALGRFAANSVAPAIQKKIASVALTKTAWYTPMKQVLKFVGVHVTKDSFAKAASKVVPVVGGVVSGGLTYVTLKVQSGRLMKHLRELPPPGVDAAAYRRMVEELDAANPDDGGGIGGVVGAAGTRIANATSGAADYFRPIDLDGDGVADEARALTAMKDAGSAAREAAGKASERVSGLFKRKRGTESQATPEDE
ncbi:MULTISPECIES: hypothetical protein [unclassified Agrococcus]|uniref:hypothetical protein n=1 Tax=unclassified Agrococcus TaxID=2615065 RepID=UPI003624195A